MWGRVRMVRSLVVAVQFGRIMANFNRFCGWSLLRQWRQGASHLGFTVNVMKLQLPVRVTVKYPCPTMSSVWPHFWAPSHAE